MLSIFLANTLILSSIKVFARFLKPPLGDRRKNKKIFLLRHPEDRFLLFLEILILAK